MAMKKRRYLPRQCLSGHVVNIRWLELTKELEFTIGQQKLVVPNSDPMKSRLGIRMYVLVFFDVHKNGSKTIAKITRNPTATQIVNATYPCK